MSLLVVTILASVIWIAAFLFYMLTSRQHNEIEREIERLRQTLDRQDRADGIDQTR